MSSIVDPVNCDSDRLFLHYFSMLASASNAEELSTISREGQKLLQQIEDSPKPVVAAILGPALGGGLEVLS